MRTNKDGTTVTPKPSGWPSFGKYFATYIVARPASFMFGTILLLLIPAVYGMACPRMGHIRSNRRTFALGDHRRGAKMIAKYFPIEDGSPLSVMLIRDQPFDSDDTLRKSM